MKKVKNNCFYTFLHFFWVVSFGFQSKLKKMGSKMANSRAIGQISSRADLSDHRLSKASNVFLTSNYVGCRDCFATFWKVEQTFFKKVRKHSTKKKMKKKVTSMISGKMPIRKKIFGSDDFQSNCKKTRLKSKKTENFLLTE